MAKNTRINRCIWKREINLHIIIREWCYTCETWVKPQKGKCPKCRNTTDPFPERIDIKNS